ncbi:helix-turn-helix domain-containing protein [Micromonospora chersina]|uniref:helix-turn-helix domain-containing protein n=1 Tax=Micromonospora chersina TaxID=47854 RepID=UPI003723FF67
MRDTQLASSAEVAAFLGVPVRTLGQWAYQGIGPKFSKIGRHRRYRWSDVERYVDQKSTDTAA